MIHYKKLLSGIYFLFFLLYAAYSQNLLNYTNSLKYADYLFETHQYNLAVVEYERVIFMEPTNSLAKFKLVQSHRYLNNHSVALKKIEAFYPQNLACLPVSFSHEYVKNLLHEHKYQKASHFLTENKTFDLGIKAEYMLGILTLDHMWTEAKWYELEHFELLSTRDNYTKLSGVIKEGLNTRYKSPALAASLSAIIPGSGKIYTQRWKDAIYSLLFVASGALLTYHSYTANGPGISSLVWGSITLGFYSANIYGSIKSAQKYNQDLNESYSRKVEKILLNDNPN